MANEIYDGPQVVFGNVPSGNGQLALSSTGLAPANLRELIEITAAGYLFHNPNNGSISQITVIKNNQGYIINSKIVRDLPSWLKQAGASGGTALPTPTLTATVVSATQVNLSVPTNANAVSYRFEQYNGTSWDIIQNTSSNTKNVTGLQASTAYQFRVKLVGDGTTYADSAYGTANATTSAAGFAFRDTMTGAAGAYGSHTPDIGTAAVTLGSAALDGNGNLVMTPASVGAFATIHVTSTIPANRKMKALGVTIPDNSDFEFPIRASSGGGSVFTNARLRKDGATTGTLLIEAEGGTVLAQRAVTGLTYPLDLECSTDNDKLISIKINNGTPLTITDTRTGMIEDVKIQTVDGVTLSEFTVEAI